jgi:hypothetical protein
MRYWFRFCFHVCTGALQQIPCSLQPVHTEMLPD